MTKPATPMPDLQELPDTKLEKRSRRVHSTEYKLRIIAEADACAHGDLGALLRKERLYSSQVQAWRRELLQCGPEGLSKTRPGPVPKRTPEQKRIESLETELKRVKRKLEVAEGCMDLQKKVLHMLDHVSSGEAS